MQYFLKTLGSSLALPLIAISMGCQALETSETDSGNVDLSALRSEESNSADAAISTLSDLRVAEKKVAGELKNITGSDLLICEEEAEAAACESNGETSSKTIVLDSCNIPGTRIIVRGYLEKSYNNADCSIENEGDEVERTYSLTYSRFRRGGELEVKSDPHYNYKGEEIGGGGVITATATGWTLQILGQQRYKEGFRPPRKPFAGQETESGEESARKKKPRRPKRRAMNVSVWTAEPVEISGTLDKSDRTANGGKIVVDHNLAEFTAEYVPSNVKWDDSCHCPVSGTFTSTFSSDAHEEKNGSGSITFNSCGNVTVTKLDGTSESLELEHCEKESSEEESDTDTE